MLKSCTRIQIEKGDGLPEQMCKQCIVQVNKSYKFKQLCEKSDAKLRLYIKNKSQSKINRRSGNVDVEEISEHSTSSVYSVEDDVIICNENIELNENKCSNLKTNNTPDTSCNNEPTNESLICAICFQTFTVRRQYTQHLRTHWNLGCYECPVCNRKCGLPSLLARHMKSHEETDKTYKCVHCDRICLGQLNLNRHIKAEHPERVQEKHTCNICRKSFVDSSLLTVHMRQHSPLSCEVCGKTFMLPNSLRKHLKVHFGNKKFIQKYDLDTHSRYHSGERPYQCSNKMTTNKLDLAFKLRKINWDPTKLEQSNNIPSATAMYRVKKDLMNLFTEPPPGLFVIADEQDIMLIHAIIVGPMETPYEGGFFYFILRCPSNYPIEPPRVKLMTTDAGRVRFNPNLYKNGKICLSILGTWTGPAWSPAQQIASLLVSIQSLMNEKPYFNEPGISTERYPGDVETYNNIIQHETLRVAVCGMLENECHLFMPGSLREIIEKNFLAFYDQYVTIAQSKLHLDGRSMKDPFGDDRGVFNYSLILTRLKKLHDVISASWRDKDTASTSSSNNNSSEAGDNNVQ
ncbi:Parkin Interacting Substrate [Carabus blaptoides fortunei]